MLSADLLTALFTHGNGNLMCRIIQRCPLVRIESEKIVLLTMIKCYMQCKDQNRVHSILLCQINKTSITKIKSKAFYSMYIPL